jgi:4-amino-4-deoxy-L-arabinose transferase-like glycosyltransferase
VSRIFKHPVTPIVFLLTINLIAGLLTFTDFGLSWDEPLFYDYADSIRAAYSPQAFSPDFNFEQVYGKSPEDHKIYGPAYLLLAWPIQRLIGLAPGIDSASAWHLVNFLTFQLGLLAFYFLIRRWFAPWPSAASSAFLAWQPVFWGHAFINPKDIPFMVLFLLALISGLEFVDRISLPFSSTILFLLTSSLLLGLASATRVIGPLAGVFVFLYLILKKSWSGLPKFLFYGFLAVLIMFIFWPYLWADPLNRILEVFKHMSNNPTELAVLFDGQVFRANEMPLRYLPQMLFLTLTEPTWILFGLGTYFAFRKALKRKVDWHGPLVFFALFVFMMAYLLYNRPSVYDGFRHFLFITPPIFIMIGFALQWLWEHTSRSIWWITISLLLLPGLAGMIHLHPYEYTYYNLFTGGVSGAFRKYETDYWLTCYKESIEWTRSNSRGSVLHIQREFPLAEYYGKDLVLKDLGKETEQDVQPGDLLLFHTRGDLDIRSIYRKLPVKHSVGRDTAEFCLIKIKD